MASSADNAASTRRRSTRLSTADTTKRSASPTDPPAQRSQKRLKTSGPCPSVEEEPEKDLDFWPSDELVVVQAERVQFKLLKSRLADESDVFSDVFAGKDHTAVEAAGTTQDGHRVYRVVKVSSLDLKWVRTTRKALPSDSLLPKETVFLLVQAREHLTDKWMRIITTPPSQSCSRNDSGPCNTQGKTAAAWNQIVRDNGWTGQGFRNDPMYGLACLLNKRWRGERGWTMCSACEAKMKDGWRKSQAKLWGQLGEWLELREEEDVAWQ
ncbi:hypothetical protein PLICRDRAFT_177390 [Plicaturopsis crispa FD-325 SS-3]|nr:hypothetical protein PLICRDRAFT_177390 [Plicaturopsis crispa FD-325 SS-3]